MTRKWCTGIRRRACFFQPACRLVPTTSRTVAVAARASDPMLSATAVTLIKDAAQPAGPATRDRTEHLAVSERDRLVELPQICRCVLPQALGDAHSAQGLHAFTTVRWLPRQQACCVSCLLPRAAGEVAARGRQLGDRAARTTQHANHHHRSVHAVTYRCVAWINNGDRAGSSSSIAASTTTPRSTRRCTTFTHEPHRRFRKTSKE